MKRLRGNLKKTPAHDLLSKISENSMTGILQVNLKQYKSIILFDEGAIVYAYKIPLAHTIQDLIKWESKLLKHQEELLKFKEDFHQVLSYLKSNNLIEISTLKDFLSVNSKNIIFDIFFATRGKFKFKNMQISYDKEILSPINTDFINMEASRVYDEWKHIVSFYPGDDVVIKKSDELSSKFLEELTDSEKAIFSKIDGTSTPSEVSFISKLPVYESKIAIAWLNQKHLITSVPKSKTTLARIKTLQKWVFQSLSSFFFIFLIVLGLLISPINPLKGKAFKGTVKFYKLYSALGAIQQNKIASAIEVYRWENGTYPPDLKSLVDQKILLKQDLTYPWGKEYYYSMSENAYILLPPGRK